MNAGRRTRQLFVFERRPNQDGPDLKNRRRRQVFFFKKKYVKDKMTDSEYRGLFAAAVDHHVESGTDDDDGIAPVAWPQSKIDRLKATRLQVRPPRHPPARHSIP